MNSPAHLRIRSHAAILAVVLIWFSPWWAAGRFLAPLDLQNRMMSPWNAGSEGRFAKNHFVADGVDQYLVYRKIAERDLRREGKVGWSSLTYGGTAQYANTMALYDDWTMHLHRWFDFKTAWHLGILGQVLIAAFGMCFWLRGRGISELWATCGGLLWAMNSQFVTWVYHRWALGSFCWVPWILWAIDKAGRGHRGSSVLVPVFLALSFLGGTLQHSALVVIVVALAYLERAGILRDMLAWSRRIRILAIPSCNRVASLPQEPDGMVDVEGVDRLGAPLHRYVVWGLLGVGLAGFMFLPAIAAFVESNRLGLHVGTHLQAPGWYPQGPLQPIFNAASYPLHFFPSLLGRCDSLDLLKVFRSDLFYVAFFGTLPMAVAVVAFRRWETPLIAKLLILAGLLIPLTPLVRVLYQRLLLLFLLGGILAFADFMTRATRQQRQMLAKWVGTVTAAAALLWGAASLVIQRPEVEAWIRGRITASLGSGGSFGYYQDWVAQRVDRFLDDLLVWSPHHLAPLVLLAIALAALWISGSGNAWRRKAGIAVVGVASILDVTLFAHRWVVWSDLPLFAETPESRALLQYGALDGRTTTVIHPEAHMALTPFVPNLLAVHGIASIHGYDSIVPDGMLRPFESPDDAGKLGRLAVSHLITWHANPDIPSPWTKVWSSQSMDIYRNPVAAPRYAGFPDQTSLDSFCEGADFEGVALEEKLGLENRREIVVPPGISQVRIAENMASGWRFRVDGGAWNEPGRGHDHCMEIDLGDDRSGCLLELVYQPPLRRWGWLLTGVSALVLLVDASRRHPRPAIPVPGLS